MARTLVFLFSCLDFSISIVAKYITLTLMSGKRDFSYAFSYQNGHVFEKYASAQITANTANTCNADFHLNLPPGIDPV